MSKGVKTLTVEQGNLKKMRSHANLSILELMDHLTNTTEELQEVIRGIDDLKEDTPVWKQQMENAYNDYLQEKAGLEEHLKKVEQLVLKKKFLSTELAGYSDAFKNRMD